MRKISLALALLLALPATALGQEAGTWIYRDNADAITREKTDFGVYPAEDEEAMVAIKCFPDGEANVLFGVMDIGSKMSMIGEDYAYLSYRVGSQLQLNEQQWSYSQDNDIALAGNVESDRIVRAIRAASASETLAFRIYNHEGAPQETVEAPIRGAKRVVGRLSCLSE